jgi:Mce-associated membrane protein
VVAILVGLGAFFGVRALQTDSEEVRREAALQTARQFVIDLTTINYQTADQDMQRLVDGSTEQFPKEFFGVDAPTFVDFAKQVQLVSDGEVTSAGVERVDETSARVLVAVRYTARDVNTPQGTPFNYRWGVDLVWTSDRWLVSKVELVL